MWSNMSPVYGLPSVIDELETSDHKIALVVPAWYPTLDTGMVRKIVTRRIVYFDPGTYHMGVFVQTAYGRGTVYVFPRNHLLDTCCLFKTVTRHSTDKPWVTDGFRHLIRQRQRARMVGDVERAK